MFIPSNAAKLDILAAAIASVLNATGPVHSTVKLAKGAFAPSPTSDPTTFTEADFDGYASKTVAAWSAAYLVPNGSAETIAGSVLTWIPTGSTTSNVVTGYWIIGGNGDYLGGEAFATPVPMDGPTTALSLVPEWQVAPGAWSGNLLP